jgi:DeoR/GlpR family transcriptional regulator of sugar metabolism
MLKAERQSQILEIIQRDGNTTVSDLAERFEVSEMTIRRDLRDLDQQGLLRRVHGGAVSDLGRSYEPPYRLRTTKRVAAKAAIGAAAAELVVDGDSIALDVGTTTLEIARALQHRHNLTILTASLPIANEIATLFSLENDVRLILTGGVVRSGELSMFGHIAQNAYHEFHVDKAFVAIGGLSVEGGLTEYNLEDALVKKPLLESAREVIVVADSSKFGQITLCSVGPLSAVDVVVTDSAAPQDMLDQLEEMGIEVIVARL